MLPLTRRHISPLVSQAVCRRRSFVGGAFASEFEETRAKLRRNRIRSFLGAFDSLQTSATMVTQELIRMVFAEHAADGSFHSKEQLRVAVDDARLRLSEQQKYECLRLELRDDTSGDSTLPEENPPGSLSRMAPSPVDEVVPDVFSSDRQQTLASIHAASVLDGLPGLWAALIRNSDSSRKAAKGDDGDASNAGDGVLPLSAALNAAFALGDPDPWTRIEFRVALAMESAFRQNKLIEEATAKSIRQAALDTLYSAHVTWATIMEHTHMMDEVRLSHRNLRWPCCSELLYPPLMSPIQEERNRLNAMRPNAAEVLADEIQKISKVQMLGRVFAGRRWDAASAAKAAESGDRPIRIIAAGDGRYSALYASLRSDSQIYLELSNALFDYHDRLSTRRRRRMNALKGTGLFVGLNLLDFTICNV